MMTVQLHNLFFIIILFACAISDIKCRTIPNIFVAVLAILAICIGIQFTGFISGILITIPMAKYKSFGDIKLIIAMGMYLGGIRLLISVIAALFVCVVYMLIRQKRSMPLAPFLFMGTILTLIGGTIL